MFEKGYTYRFVYCKNSDTLPYSSSLYRFKTIKNKVYWVIIEQYDYNIYVVKFHLAQHKSSKKRFNFVLNDGDAGRVIRTVIDIMVVVLEKDPLASIGFIGSEKYTKTVNEDKSNTQRFRIYKYITNNYFGLENFEHYYDLNNSAYIVVNKNNKDCIKIIREVPKMFQDLYSGLEEFDTIRVSSVG